jgi:hypothetical protein
MVYQNVSFSQHFQSMKKPVNSMHDMIAFIASQISYDMSSDDDVLDLIGDQLLTGAQLDAIFILINTIKNFEKKLVNVMAEACNVQQSWDLTYMMFDHSFFREVCFNVIKQIKLDTTYETYEQFFSKAFMQSFDLYFSKFKITDVFHKPNVLRRIQLDQDTFNQIVSATFTEWDSLAQGFYPEISQILSNIKTDPEYVNVYLEINQLVYFDYDSELSSYYDGTNDMSANLNGNSAPPSHDWSKILSGFAELKVTSPRQQLNLSELSEIANINNLEFDPQQSSYTFDGLIEVLCAQFDYDFWDEFINRFENTCDDHYFVCQSDESTLRQCAEMMCIANDIPYDFDDLLSKLSNQDIHSKTFPVEILFRILSQTVCRSTYILDSKMDIALEISNNETTDNDPLVICRAFDNAYILLRSMDPANSEFRGEQSSRRNKSKIIDV